MLGWFLRAIIWRKCPFGEENIEESHQKIQYILQNIQKKTISFRKLPIYNKKPMSLRKGIGFCQQSEATLKSGYFNTSKISSSPLDKHFAIWETLIPFLSIVWIIKTLSWFIFSISLSDSSARFFTGSSTVVKS